MKKRSDHPGFFSELLAKFQTLRLPVQVSALSAAGLLLVGGIGVGAFFLLDDPDGMDSVPSSELSSILEPSSKNTSSILLSSEESSEISSEEESSEDSSAPASSKPASSAPASSKPASSSTPSAPANNVTTDAPTVAGDLAALYAKNADIRGQVSIAGTKLNEIVVQGGDNAFYLNHDIYKNYNAYGSAFMDFRASLSSSQIITIYGHSNDNQGTYLSAAKQYRNLDFYKQHPTLTFNTIYGSNTYKVIGLFLENVNVSNCFNYWDYVNPTSDQFNYYISQARGRSFITTTVDVQYGDRILALSTCLSSTSKNSRYVLVARQVRAGEDTGVDTSGAYLNTNMIPASGPLN